MKTGWFVGGALSALVMWTAACGSDGGSGSTNGNGSSPDGGGVGTEGGKPSANADGGGTSGDDGGTKPGTDGGDAGGIAAGTVFGPPVMGGDNFGFVASFSADGTTFAIGAPSESSSATGINGDQTNTTAGTTGAAYVYASSGGAFTLQAYVKASTIARGAQFGTAVAISADGSTLVVGSPQEKSNATGINGNQADVSMSNAGAAYVFTRSGTTWSQQAYIKASNTQAEGRFGQSVAISGDGNTVVIGSIGESGASTGVNGDQTPEPNNHSGSGAAYVFTRSGATWSQQAYVKASTSNHGGIKFGGACALSGTGDTMFVSALWEQSNATGIDGDQTNSSLDIAGAVYAFVRSGTTWTQQAYIKASNTRANQNFGAVVSTSGDGNTLVVGAYGDSSNGTGVNGNQADTSLFEAGAAFVFTRNGTTWSQQAYLKPSDTAANFEFGWSTSMSTTGDSILIGAPRRLHHGAGYRFTRTAGTWTEKQILTPFPNDSYSENVGAAVAMSTTPERYLMGSNITNQAVVY